tara:strand:+ start:5347 stop:5718 length:372 start_codon:yes stop_codon:yes gene_type:complete
MKKGNDFRLGNLVECRDGFGRVTGIQDREVLEVGEIGYIMEDIKPIDITNRILLICGFVLETFDSIDFYNLKLGSDKYGISLTYVDCDNTFNVEDFQMTHIEHVHQLQNLYFALTGEELTFKL